MAAHTVKNNPFGKGPKKTKLLGDKSKKIESTTHIIEFPGGAVEVSRCEDGSYWAHIIINRVFGQGDADGMTTALGEITDTRVDYEDPKLGVCDITPKMPFTQVAVRIKPVRP